MSAEALVEFSDRLREISLLSALDPARGLAPGARLTREEQLTSNALNRSSIVLLSAHLEGFLESLAAGVLDALVANAAEVHRLPLSLRAIHVDGPLKQVVEIADPNKRYPRIQALFASHSAIWDDSKVLEQSMINVGAIVDRMSNPQEKAIVAFLSYVGVDIRDHLNQVGKLPLLQRATSLVDLRNQIAHGGQVSSTTYSDLDDYLRDVSELCVEMGAAAAASVQAICKLNQLPW